MTPLYVINDTHLGAQRSGGTTPLSAWQLRLALLQDFENLLASCDGDVLINGDWLDTERIQQYDLLETFHITVRWLARGFKLFAARGNHDDSKNKTQMSSFDFLVQLLHSLYPEQVVPLFEAATIRPGVHVVPHVPNQALLDLELERVPAGTRFLMLHTNYDNQFAVEKDHSLNLSKEQAEALDVEYIVLGHEHQGRTELGGKVVIIGNQFCSSVSDCLGQPVKHMMRIDGDCYALHQTWQAEGNFAELDWRELQDTGARFVRVVGHATADEANLVVNAISRFRGTCSSFVVTSAVKIEGVDDSEQFELTHEEVSSFSVRDALREILDDVENAKVDWLRNPVGPPPTTRGGPSQQEAHPLIIELLEKNNAA